MPTQIIRDGEVVAVETKLQHKHMWNLGASLVQDIAQDSVNKIDKKEWKLNKISNITKNYLQKVFRNSQHQTWKKQIGHYLSTRGTRAAVAYVLNGKIILDHMEVISFKSVAYELEHIYLTDGQLIEIDGTKQPMVTHFFRKLQGNGVYKILKEVGYMADHMFTTDGPVFVNKGPIFTYPQGITRIPVEIINNNERGLSDIGNVKMWDAIKELSYHSGELGTEYETTKAMWGSNENFSSGQKPLSDVLASGERVIKQSDMASKLGNPDAPVSLGGMAAVGPMAHADYIEDKIRKYTHTQAQTDSTGTNKHNTEVDKFNQKATEYLDNKKEQREQDYTSFVSKLIELAAALKHNVSKADMDKVEVKLTISEMEQAVIDRAKESSNPTVKPAVKPTEDKEEK